MYEVVFTDAAAKQWKMLDGIVKKLIAQALKRRQLNPFVPGSELHGELSGCYKIKFRAAGIRLVYRVDGERLLIIVLSVGARERGQAHIEAQDNPDL